MVRNGRRLTNDQYPVSRSLVSNRRQILEYREGFTFSFRYFHQLKGVAAVQGCDARWFLSLLNRLRSIEQMNVSPEILLNRYLGDKALRLHRIDWSLAPISVQDLQELPTSILESEQEFPFYQFSLSTGTGRFIGFFDDQTFYVVLLDPNHNIQPTKKDNYQLQSSNILYSQYDHLWERLQAILTSEQLREVEQAVGTSNLIYAYIDDDFLEKYRELLSQYTHTQILEQGILALS